MYPYDDINNNNSSDNPNSDPKNNTWYSGGTAGGGTTPPADAAAAGNDKDETADIQAEAANGEAQTPGDETRAADGPAESAQQSSGPVQDGSEYHYVRPDAGKSWRDAEYTPQDEATAPPRYYVPEEKPKKVKKPREKGKVTFAKVACLCLVCALIGGLAGGAIAGRSASSTASAVSTPVLTTAADTSGDSAAPTATQIASGTVITGSQIYELACEQVVGISSDITGTNYFGMQVSGSVSGSGFIISSDGYILTNNHVISDARQSGSDINVMLHDGTTYVATVVGYDEDNDIAVLKIDADGLTPVTLGNSDSLSVGDTVYAVGNPLGELAYSMSSGIVSATDRVITTDESTSINMFQIDAAVNAGNSGGPVYNIYGQVVGIVTAKYGSSTSSSSSDTSVEGLGFAIPINDAVTIANDLIQNGYVTGKAYMGITGQTVNASVAQYYNMVEGAYVYSVESGSCAEKAGLKIGDIITQMDGVTITSFEDLKAQVKSHSAGDTVSITAWRSGETLTLTLTFDEETPDTTAAASQQTTNSGTGTQSQYPFSQGW